MNLTKQDKAVHEYLNEIKVRYTPQHMAEMLHDEWKHDLFLVTFQQVGTQNPKCLEYFDFKTGVGHRITSNNKSTSWNSNLLTPRQVRDLKVYKEHSGPSYEAKHVLNRGRKREWIVCPTAASVLYCLLADSEANDISFNEWCERFGCDSDSITHLNTYRACCDNAKKLSKVFTRAQLEHLQTLLEDY